MRTKQYSIGKDPKRKYGEYLYLCNGCGCVVGGYNVQSLMGNVWCAKCYKKRQENYIKSKRDAENQKIIDKYNQMLISAIERSTKHGVPSLDKADLEFVYERMSNKNEMQTNC